MAPKKREGSTRQVWREEDMQNAIRNVASKNMGWRLASNTFNVPFTTLRRRVKQGKGSKKDSLGGNKPVFDVSLERLLVDKLKDLESRFFGLTANELRKLVYQIAEENKLKHNFNCQEKKAGYKWLKGFLGRNPQISLRTPENTSIARAQAFNKENIKEYFKALENIMEIHNFRPENTYNVDETGLSTVQTKASKILATKGRKQVGAISSAERGQNFTLVCCTNALGQFIPPALIFPRKRFKEELMNNAPTGSVAFCQENGWMTSELFERWLEHFIIYAKPSNENKVLLVLDGHVSHKGLSVLERAKNNGIILFCFPAHCTHKLQPLDVGIFGPLQIYYNQEIQNWLRNNPGKTVTYFQVAALVNQAQLKACVPQNSIHAFKKTGIFPYDSDIFSDWEFAPSLTTNREQSPCISTDATAPKMNPNTVESTINTEASCSKNYNPEGLPENSDDILRKSVDAAFQVPTISINTNLKRTRKRAKTGHLNNTPEIQELKRQVEEKEAKEREKKAKQIKRQILSEHRNSNKGVKKRRSQSKRETKSKSVIYEEREQAEKDPFAVEDDDSDAACIYCNELFTRGRAGECWIRCQLCNQWCHAECAGVDKRIKMFTCELCLD